jgi:hypothetical protein
MALLAVIVIWFLAGIVAALSFGRLTTVGGRPAPIRNRQVTEHRALIEKRRRSS